MDTEINKFAKIRKEFTSKWKILIIIGGIILFIFILLLIFINLNILDNKKILRNIIDETNKNKSLLDMTIQSLLLLSNDSNEIRSHLGFSQKDYPVFNTDTQDPEAAADSEENTDDILFFKALERIRSNYNIESGKLIFNDFIKDKKLTALLNQNGLQIIEDNSISSSIIKNSNKFFTMRLLEDTLKIQIEDFSGESIEADTFDNNVLNFMQKKLPELSAYYNQLKEKNDKLAATIADSAISNLIKEKKLTVSKPVEDNDANKYEISFNNQSVFYFGINKSDQSYFINNQKFKDLEEWKSGIIKNINEIELANNRFKQILLSQKKIQSIFKDEAFIALLDSNNLTIAQKPREEHYFTYYDVINKSGIRFGSFAVENFTGDIYIMDKDDVQISALNALADKENLFSSESGTGSKKKIEIPEYIPEIKDFYNNTAGITFLICGSNESNTDTIIIVNVDEKKKTVTLFAIPRDLYYKGRRINTVFYGNGEDEFLNVLSQITGLKIGKYIHINMFAFVEVINILGGIDFALDYDLIDPSYKIKDNGQWSTLYYKKGNYHLNGIQALRIARSRHFSSDFDRSRRQQRILIAIKNRFGTFGITGLDKISTIVTTLLKYVKTNLSIFEILQYYNKYKDYSINAQHTLDTSNILYNTYSNLYLLSQEEKDALSGTDFDKGAWILLPKKNDWNMIKWYIRELINPE